MFSTLFKADETLLHLEVCYFVYCAVNWLCVIDGRVGVPLMVRGRVARGRFRRGYGMRGMRSVPAAHYSRAMRYPS